MGAPRFKIGEKLYSTAALNEISLRDILRFEAETAAEGVPTKWHDMQVLADELGDLNDAGKRAEAEQHPQALMLLAVTIWASRRVAGENVTFAEAIDFPIVDLVMLPGTEDNKPGPTRARKGPKKKGPARPHPGSARAANEGADVPDLSATSETKSPPD